MRNYNGTEHGRCDDGMSSLWGTEQINTATLLCYLPRSQHWLDLRLQLTFTRDAVDSRGVCCGSGLLWRLSIRCMAWVTRADNLRSNKSDRQSQTLIMASQEREERTRGRHGGVTDKSRYFVAGMLLFAEAIVRATARHGHRSP